MLNNEAVTAQKCTEMSHVFELNFPLGEVKKALVCTIQLKDEGWIVTSWCHHQVIKAINIKSLHIHVKIAK